MTLAAPTDPASPSPDEPPPTADGRRPDTGTTSGDSPLSIDLSLHVPDADPPLAGWLEPTLAQAAHFAGVTAGRLALVIVDDAEMAQLHLQWKNVPGTTDVLTFDLSEPHAPDNEPEGDIVVCLDEARRQAAVHGHTLRHEALLYAVHGLLHLLGEDDQDPAAYQRMHQREDELLTRLGIGPIFDRDRKAT